MGKTKVNPVLAIIACVVVLVLAGLFGWKMLGPGGLSGEKTANVRPANPDDPKFKPSPRLGLGGGGT